MARISSIARVSSGVTGLVTSAKASVTRRAGAFFGGDPTVKSLAPGRRG
jgi:hypothetical protein